MYLSSTQDLSRNPKVPFYSPYLGQMQKDASQTALQEEASFLERVLQAHIARSIKRRGQPQPDLGRHQLSPVKGTIVEMRTDAADMAGKMIAAANQDLAQASANGDADAQRTVRISATSGYRGSAHQERLWREYFRTRYYPQTAADRAPLPGGPHGEAAIQFMLDYVAPKIAAPGFSNHQAGVAIDLWQERTAGNEIRNSTSTRPVNWLEKWRRTWFFDWLQRNAAGFHFHPYPVEPWHWEYRSQK